MGWFSSFAPAYGQYLIDDVFLVLPYYALSLFGYALLLVLGVIRPLPE